ncbi:MAG: TIGR01777 family oxidoreductase [Planctomycetota bacterium]
MPDKTFTLKTPIDAPPAEVWAWHLRDGALPRLTPPWEFARLLKYEGLQNGQRVVLEVKAPWKRKWVAVHQDYIEGLQFRDVQAEGPFAKWEHTHRMEPDPQTAGKTCVMHDHVRYQMPFWLVGEIAHAAFGRDKIEQMFAYRHATLKADLAEHQQAREHTAGRPLTVAITGASGMIGSSLSAFLSTGGHTVRPIQRSGSGGKQDGIGFNASPMLASDAVVHLAGEPIAQKWTPGAKRRIYESRVQGTRLLCEALAGMDRKPKVLVVASGISIYGDRGDELLAEHDAPALDPHEPWKEGQKHHGFLAKVAHDWEHATKPAAAAGIRVVNARFGIVLSPQGGALQKMLTPFSFGAGGKVGSGKQWWSWIGIQDAVSILHQAIIDETMVGPINACSPQTVTNAQFTKVLGKVLGRPTLLPVPKFVVKAAFGQMGTEALLGSQRIDPAQLRRAGFAYRHEELEPCLRTVLGKRRGL